MLCATLGITQDVRPDHAQYLAHWLEIMKSDAKAIFTAAAAAARAVDYLESLQPGPGPSPPTGDATPERPAPPGSDPSSPMPRSG